MDPQVNSFLLNFFSAKLDICTNRAIEGCLNDVQVKRTLAYIDELTSIPLKDFIEYICMNPSAELISSLNYTQCSHIELCHIKMCRAFKSVGCKGLTNSEIGIILHQDFPQKEQHSSTNAKFGENVKGASQFGLAISKAGKWYLTSFGFVFDMLDSQKQAALMARVLLRDPFYAHLIREATHREVNIYDEMVGISETTKIRRLGNIATFCKIVTSQVDMDEEIILHSIIAQKPKK